MWPKLSGKIIVCLLIVALATTGMVGCAPKPKEVFRLQFTSTYPSHLVASQCAEWWMTGIESRTEGRVTFERIWAGALTKPGEELDHVGTGVADVAILTTVYYPSKLILASLNQAVPFCPTDTKEGLAILEEIYDEFPAFDDEMEQYNNKLIYISFAGPCHELQSIEPIRTIADLKGKKAAVSGVYQPRMWEVLGPATLPMPVTERYTAFQTGLIDAGLIPLIWAHTFAFFDFCEYNTHPMLGSMLGGYVVMNLDVWKKLPKDIQKMMLELGKEAGRMYADQATKEREELVAEYEKKGVTFFTFSPEDMKRWAELMPEIPLMWVKDAEAQGKPGKKILKRYLELCKEHGHVFPREWSTE